MWTPDYFPCIYCGKDGACADVCGSCRDAIARTTSLYPSEAVARKAMGDVFIQMDWNNAVEIEE